MFVMGGEMAAMGASMLLAGAIGLVGLVLAIVVWAARARCRMNDRSPGTLVAVSGVTKLVPIDDAAVVDEIRASDADRAHAAAALGNHMAAGRLMAAEFDDRVRVAYDSHTVGDLRSLFTDLPRAEDVDATAPRAKGRGDIHSADNS